MRIRQIAGLLGLSCTDGSTLPSPSIPNTQVCKLNQSPWDIILIASSSSQSDFSFQDEYLVVMKDNLTSNNVEGESASVSESIDSIKKKSKEEPVEEDEKKKGMKESVLCFQSDGKGWSCQREAKENRTLCEHHLNLLRQAFNGDEEAVKAYNDIGAQGLPSRVDVTNMKPLGKENEIESVFLSSQLKYQIVDVLDDDELEQSRVNYGQNKNEWQRNEGICGSDVAMKTCEQRLIDKSASPTCEHLFDKSLTPSDIGSLNRLVIPKRQAVKHFPLQFAEICKGVTLKFEENGGKVWRFRYCYWTSSKSYVLTKGWRRFVKEKNLKEGDVVSFFRSIGEDKKLYIAWEALSSLDSCSLEPYQDHMVNSVPETVTKTIGVSRKRNK